MKTGAQRLMSHLGGVLIVLSIAVPGPASTLGMAWASDESLALARSYNASGFELFGELAKAPGNLVISPYSIGTAMTMAFAGARGDTEADMARVLKYAQPRAAIVEANQQLNTVVTQRSPGDDATIAVANALHLTKYGGLVAASYNELLRTKFSAELFSGSDLPAINGWVKEKTNGKIERILSRLDPNSVCVILNAIYFKGRWAAPFDERATSLGEFHLSRSETIKVPMMRQSGRFRILRAHAYDAIALPYKGDGLTMIILLPMRFSEQGQVDISIDDQMTDAVIDGLERSEPERVELSMPKFKTEYGTNLIPPFRTLGLELPFDRDRADFSGVTESMKEVDRIHISQIEHKAYIDVNEAGTEAAAATAVEFALKSPPPDKKIVKIDHPFIYLITDKASHAILFIGRVSDPRM